MEKVIEINEQSRKSKINALLGVKFGEPCRITYLFENGTKKSTDLNPEMLRSMNGRERRFKDVLEDIDAIAHDYNAVSYSIN